MRSRGSLAHRLAHPALLWIVVWAVAVAAHLAHLLPYRPLSLRTIAVIAAGAVLFSGAAVLGGRRQPRAGSVGRAPAAESVAKLLASAAAAWTLVYAFSVSRDFGLEQLLVTSPVVRQANETGAYTLEIKFIYVVFAACPAVALAVAQARDSTRYRWIAVLVALHGMAYLSTGRANVIVCFGSSLIVLLIATRRSPSARALATVALATAVIGVCAFAVMGAIIGKTFSNSDLVSVDSVFTRHPEISSLATPYEYVSAPIGALNTIVTLNDLPRTDGCSTLASACTILRRIGVPVRPVPEIRPFTAPPLRWNTYTVMEAPIADFGLAGILLLAPLGYFCGLLWRRATSGRPLEIVAYGIVSMAVITSAGSNNFTAAFYVGAIILQMLTAAVLMAKRRVWRKVGRSNVSVG